MFAVDKREVVRIHGSSGTTGKPKIVGYTKQDLDNWSEIMARVICAAGGTPDDIVQIAFGYGLFTGGFGLHYGMEKIGAMVVPLSSGNTERQLMIMQDFGSTILIATPSYALYLADEIEKRGIDKTRLSSALRFSEAKATRKKCGRRSKSSWASWLQKTMAFPKWEARVTPANAI